MSEMRFLISGDCAVTVELGQEIHPAVNARVRAAQLALERAALRGVVELVPTYCALTVHYDPGILCYDILQEHLQQLLSHLNEAQLPPATVLEIPVLYGGECGPDLAAVSQHCGLSQAEVIQCHSDPEYLIYMLGFTPGFPYLGGMDHRLATPRLEVPRVRIPGGSVGIAGTQTGIYPIDSPGGWQLIGRTPVRLYDPARATPILARAGDYLKFFPISQQEFDQIAREVDKGTYVCPTHLKKEVPL